MTTAGSVQLLSGMSVTVQRSRVRFVPRACVYACVRARVRTCVRARCTRVFKWSSRHEAVAAAVLYKTAVGGSPKAERNARSIPPSSCLHAGNIHGVSKLAGDRCTKLFFVNFGIFPRR